MQVLALPLVVVAAVFGPIYAPLEPAKSHAWQAAWNDAVARAIDAHAPELVEDEALAVPELPELCPGFFQASRLERQGFWALFFAAIARYESGFDPKARMQEAWKDPETGKPQYSEGLLQLSYSDKKGHPACALDRKAKNIFDPEVNLACGVVILKRQLQARSALFPGPRPYYWAVLTNAQSKAKVEAFVRAHAPQVAACRRGIRGHPPKPKCGVDFGFGGCPQTRLRSAQDDERRAPSS